MSLQFILGPPGAGKTTRCLNEIEAAIPGTAPLYYLVPEQFSLQSERLLLAERAATTRVQVLSFNRLAYRLFSFLGGPPGQVADELGKTMILRKVLIEISEDLVFYRRGADKHGFVDALASTITELNHYCVSSEDLLLRSEQASPSLGAKLVDLALILSRYRAAVKGRYLLADDMLDLLAGKLCDTDIDIPLLNGAKVWADGFTGFTPQERQVLLYLMKQGADVRVTLTTRDMPVKRGAGGVRDASGVRDAIGGRDASGVRGAASAWDGVRDKERSLPDPLFSLPRNTKEKLVSLARGAGIVVLDDIYMKENYRHVSGGGLAFFTHNFSMGVKARKGEVPKGLDGASSSAMSHEGIEILSAPDRYAAVYAAAHRVLSWVNQDGYRFRDIAIVCGDRGHYEKTLQTAFDRLRIPLFVDTEIDILSHPLTELVRSALSILAHNWNYESVFRFIKTRLTGLDINEADILENFALAYGISGYKWRYPFMGPAEAGRLHLLAALESFGTSQAKDTVRNFSRKVFEMLYALKVPDTLQKWFDAHMEAGDPATARIHKQIWPKICEVFDKLVEILGDEKLSLESFASVLDAGLGHASLGRIPPTVDQVVLGDMGRSRYPQIKAMLVLGANDGVLPPIPSTPGLFTEDERIQLTNADVNLGLELAPDNLSRINEQYYALYCVLSQPKEILSFIYAEGMPNGKVLRPSHVLKRVQGLFPRLEVERAPILREYDPLDQGQAEESTVLAMAGDLYGQTIATAASRLEAFARCPFAYFMDYLLQARPRAKYQVLPTDLGNFYHDILARFTNNVANGSLDINKLDREGINRMVNEMVSQIVTTHSPEMATEMEIFQSTARNQHILDKAQRICAASIWALCEHIKRGSFVPLGSELGFDQGQGLALEDGRKLLLSGRIDRVDLLKGKDGEQYVRVIDYKSGNAKFDIAEVEQGIQLQLMLYINALTKNPKVLETLQVAAEADAAKADDPKGVKAAVTENEHITKPGGVFYFPVDDPIIDADNEMGDEARSEALLKRFRMSGVALDGDNILEGMDNSLAPGVESTVIPIKRNKDGRIGKTLRPQVLAAEDFEKLGKAAEDKVKELGLRMVQGDIQANPVSRGVKNPCQYCGYGAICGGSCV